MGYTREAKIFPQIKNHRKILGASRVIWSQSETEYPQAVGAGVKNYFAMLNLRPGFIYPWLTQHASQ
jgi:hypothetical protein